MTNVGRPEKLTLIMAQTRFRVRKLEEGLNYPEALIQIKFPHA